ncbi:uncharacterized protein LOC115005362 [Cottoperca gobio]|uniref:Uncharacterized protein LOC115005362 n=1 Tax=Cottoperca gobio TaxID=56716 RepID=A0A6J2PCY5_COTGO|nr:uncharacterized protein LOC115005362 [Cottoperca gobio]
MEVLPCAQEASDHATSLLASLSLQREQVQFCDCVLRQRQNPGQLHPAHRCVLAASSPVLASILSSTGALVELQAPCLSDSVLALLLDYIYTGTMPYSHNQHQYHNLLSAACYLEMDGLQEALKARQQIEVKEADNTNASTGTFRNYLREDHPYSAHVNTCDDIDPYRSSSKKIENHCSRKNASTLVDVSTCCSISESTGSSVNRGNCGQVPQDLIQNIPCTAEVHKVSGEDKQVHKDLFHSAHSAGTEKPETCQGSTDEELERTVEDRRRSNLLCTSEVREEETSRTEKMQRLCSTMKSKAEVEQTNRKEEDKTQICHSPLLRLSTSHMDNVSPSQSSSSSSSSAPHPCCGEVTVIRHSSRAAMLQLAEVASITPYHPVTQASVSSNRANFWMATAAEEQSIHLQDLRAVIPLPVQDSDTGSDSHCKDLWSEGETEKEHSYLRCPAVTDRQDRHCDLRGPKTDCYPNLHRAEKSTKDAAFCQHVFDSVNRDEAITFKRYKLCRPVSPTHKSCSDSVTAGLSGFECCTSVEHEKMSGTEITGLTFKLPTVHNMSDPTYSVVGPSYRGHLQYHLTQEETHLSHGYAGHKHPHPESSDQSSDDKEVSTCASPDYNSLRQHFATGTTDQVLLLDISTKPAELLVDNALRQMETFGNGFGSNDREQLIERKSEAGVHTKYRVGETNEEQEKRKRVGKCEVIHKAGVEERVSKHKEGESQITTSVQDSVHASMSSTNTSAHLSKPVHHPFQCSLCNRSYSQRGSLNRHVRSHLGVRPFPCPRCPMTFSRQYRVTEHMRVHQRCVILSDFSSQALAFHGGAAAL